jgi:hypothetical protein
MVLFEALNKSSELAFRRWWNAWWKQKKRKQPLRRVAS